MRRAITGIVVGLAASWAIRIFGLTVAYLALGANKAFYVGTFDVSPTWILTSIVVGLAAALIAGLTCTKLANATKPTLVMALFIFVFGLGAVFFEMATIQASIPRTADVGMIEALKRMATPVWISMMYPVVSVVGVIAGMFVASGATSTEADSEPVTA